MRLLTLLATTVLLAACVHDTNDFNLFAAESGASLTYYIGSAVKADEEHDDPWTTITEKFGIDAVHTGKKNNGGNEPFDDPWDTIGEKFGVESVHAGKSGHDDPWDVIGESFPLESVHIGKSGHKDPWDVIGKSFPLESVHTGKSGEDDPWNRINDLFPAESVHSGKTNDRLYFGIEKSSAVFLSFSYQLPTTYRAQVAEVRGQVTKLEFADGVEQYVIDAPASWTEGAQLETGFLEATTKKDRPFLGVRFWRTVEGDAWDSQSRNLALELPDAWPSEYHASGASLLVSLTVGQKSHDDPWSTIKDKFDLETVHTGSGKSHDDPWDEVMTNFSEESVHTGSGKSHDDPWDTINDSFPIESVHSGKRKGRSFKGKPVVDMVFVRLGGKKGEKVDSWNRTGELFPSEKNGGVLLKLVEVRGQVGRLQFVSASGGELLGGGSIFAVGVPPDWESGTVLRGEAYLLNTEKMLPLIPRSGSASSGPPEAVGAVTWETDPILR